MTYDQLVCWVDQALQQVNDEERTTLLKNIKNILDGAKEGKPVRVYDIRKNLSAIIDCAGVEPLISASFADRKDAREHTPGQVFEYLNVGSSHYTAFMISLKRFEISPQEEVEPVVEPISLPELPENEMEYRVTFDDMMEAKRQGGLDEKVAFENQSRHDFFQVGSGGFNQFLSDYFDRSLILQGQEHLGFDLWPTKINILERDAVASVTPDQSQKKQAKIKAPSDAEIVGRIKSLINVGEDDEELYNAFIEAHSQGPAGFMPFILYFSVSDVHKIGEADAPDIIPMVKQPDPRMWVKIDEEKNLHMKIELQDFPICYQKDGRTLLGVWPGPVEVNYVLRRKDGQWGFQLSHIDTDDELIHRATLGGSVTSEELLEKHGDEEAINRLIAQIAVAKLIEYIGSAKPNRVGEIVISNDRREQLGNDFALLIMDAIQRVRNLDEDGGADVLLPNFINCITEYERSLAVVQTCDLDKLSEQIKSAFGDALDGEAGYYLTMLQSAFRQIRYVDHVKSLKYRVDQNDLITIRGGTSNATLNMFASKGFTVDTSATCTEEFTLDDIKNVNSPLMNILKSSLNVSKVHGSQITPEERITFSPNIALHSYDIRHIVGEDGRLMVICDNLPISVMRENKPDEPDKPNKLVQIGKLDGEMRAVFEFVEDASGKKDQLKLVSLEADNEDYLRAFRGEYLKRIDLIKKYCVLDELRPDDLDYTELKDLLTHHIESVEQQYPDSTVPAAARAVLENVDNLRRNTSSGVSELKLKEVLLETSNLVAEPTRQKAQNFKTLANNVRKRPWGKVLGGVMLALAGVAIMGLSIAACVFTFGAAAPVSVFGFMLGASTLGAGLSVAGAVVGTGVVAGGVRMFRTGFKRKPLRKAMDDLADDESFKGPGR